ncbi:hypothetical protein Misp03_63090 [Microbispora sp. NBRC 16548]|nr:hypothetical protein Misp03_63090 [Microbispora sp. NBRC 16548]
MSLGRCQLAVTVEAPTAMAQAEVGSTTTQRNRWGITRTSAHMTDIATVVWPLGKLWSSRRTPDGNRIGRSRTR